MPVSYTHLDVYKRQVHTFIMDAFREAGAETDEMDEMKRWLLKQKQTQLWE